jgi:NADH-quinone oxidoreductase E subunit
MAPDTDSFEFSGDNMERARAILAKYPEPRKQSAVLPLLHLAQRQHGGWLPQAVLDYVADFLGMPRIRVYEVASFYDMYNMHPVGRTQVRVCTTTPCWLCGSDDVVRACRDALGVDVGESTPDGRFYLREFECLGACANAPVLWIDDDFYEDLDYARTKEIVETLKRGERPRPGPQNGRVASMPLGGKTTLLDAGD